MSPRLPPQEDALRALQDVEALVSAPVHHMLSWLAAKRMPLLTCTTNYVPCQQVRWSGMGWAGVAACAAATAPAWSSARCPASPAASAPLPCARASTWGWAGRPPICKA